MPIFTEETDVVHYGVKGMRWGVRRYRSGGSRAGAAAMKLAVGNEATSLATARGRKDFKKNVKADVNKGKKILGKISDNKVFKTLVYDKDMSILTKAGRTARAKNFQKNAEKRYQKALKKEKDKHGAQVKRAKETKKLIEQLIKEDKATNKFFGRKTDEAADRAYWEKLFESDLKVDPLED